MALVQCSFSYAQLSAPTQEGQGIQMQANTLDRWACYRTCSFPRSICRSCMSETSIYAWPYSKGPKGNRRRLRPVSGGEEALRWAFCGNQYFDAMLSSPHVSAFTSHRGSAGQQNPVAISPKRLDDCGQCPEKGCCIREAVAVKNWSQALTAGIAVAHNGLHNPLTTAIRQGEWSSNPHSRQGR